jgi:hypothetical protein
VTAAPFRADRIYLGWQHALVHPDPGPAPRRPVPPEQEQLNAGWVAAQRREEKLLNRPLKLTAGGCLVLAGIVVALAVAGILNASLTGLGLAVLITLASISGRGLWRGQKELRGRVEQEKRRVATARAAAESRLFGWQDEHARMFRDWQARGRAFAGQLQWYAVALPGEIDRVDVAGGTLSGWSAMLTMVAGPRLAAGGEVTVLDMSEGAVAQDLLAVARGSGIDPLVWVLPADLPGFDLGAGLPREALADVLAMSVAMGGDRAGPPDATHDYAILDRITEVIGDEASIAQVTAGLRALAQVGDPREDIRRGLITVAQLEEITAMYGRGAADRVVIERAWALEAKLRKLEALGSAPVPLNRSRLRVIAVDPAAGVAGNTVLATFVTVALTHVLRQAPPGQPWQHTLCLTGAEKLRGDVLDRLCDACEATRTGLVLAYRSLPGHVKERLGRGNAAIAFMRLGNAEDAKAASEQIGTAHRFMLTQLTDTVGTSVTETVGDSYTSTIAAADSVSVAASTSETAGRSRGRGHSSAGFGPFAQHTGSGSRDSSRSWGTSDTESLTEGITFSTAWGISTSQAIGANASLARSTQRSREFLVEQHELQQLPPSAVIISYASRRGRRVVLADANPGILVLPTATCRSLEEVRDAAPMAPEPVPAAAGDSRGPAPGTAGVPAGFGGGGGPGANGGAGAGSGAGAGGGTGASGAERGASGAQRAASGPAAPGDGDGDAAGAGGGTGQPRVPAGTGPVPPPTRDPAAAPVSWRDAEEKPPPNLGPPPEPLDWRKRRK